MKKKPQRRLANDLPGKRVLQRYRNARGMLRARVPLVLRRNGAPGSPPPRRGSLQTGVARYQFSLHVHLSHFGWLPARARHVSQQPVTDRYAVLRTLSVQRGQTLAVETGRRRSARLDGARGLTATPQATPVRVARPHVDASSSATRLLAGTAPAPAQPSVMPGHSVLAGASAARMRDAAPRGTDVSQRPMHFRVDATRDTLTRLTFAESLARRQAAPLAAPYAQATVNGRPAPVRTHAQAAALPASNRTSSPAAVRDNGPAATRAVGRDLRVHAEGGAARMSGIAPQVVRLRSGTVANDAPRSPLYSQSAPRTFVTPSVPAAAQPAPVHHEQRPIAPPPPAPQLDIAQLSDDVYRHIERKLRIERERRGL